ncbi:MAG: mercuric reductase [bacterium]
MKYDAIIIGSGQAGNPLSHGLADRGWTVALIERKDLGGTCVNTGCTPTKAMIHRAQVAHYARHAGRWGVRAVGVQVDLAQIVSQKEALVRRFRSGQQQLVERRPNLHLYREPARFVGPQRIEAGPHVLESERIFVDTGTRPRIPDIPGLDAVPCLTNESLMQETEVPRHLLVLGAGYVGLEFAQMFLRFGSRVTVIEGSSQILSREDREVAAELQKALEAEGIDFRLGVRVSRAERTDGGIALTLERSGDSGTVAGSHLLVAVGRRPNTDDLHLEKAGVETDSHGFIKVNARLETTAPGIWALGDVKGGPAFTHISYNDYQIVYGNLVEGANRSIDGRIVPYCVFTDPQLGGIGMTEKEARANGYRLKIGEVPMSRVARALERDETAGLMKIIVNQADDRILGASILSSEGGELVQILGFIMAAGLPYSFLKGAVYIHPTLAEGLFALMEDVKPAD